MARLARVVAPRLPHHVIQRGVRSIAIFSTDEDREAYLALVAEFAARWNLAIWAWCLMTNHVHLAWERCCFHGEGAGRREGPGNPRPATNALYCPR